VKPGDLVFHLEDVRDAESPGPVPGLIVGICDPRAPKEAIVYFTDRTFAEYHKLEDLVKVEDYDGEKEWLPAT